MEITTKTGVTKMNSKARRLMHAVASLTIAIAAIAPSTHARLAADGAPAAVTRAVTTQGIHPSADRREVERAAAVTGSGLDRTDAALGAGILIAIALMGLWGHVVVGATIAIIAWPLAEGARLVTGRPKHGRGWSDRPGRTAVRVEQRQARHGPRFRRPELGQTVDPNLR